MFSSLHAYSIFKISLMSDLIPLTISINIGSQRLCGRTQYYKDGMLSISI